MRFSGELSIASSDAMRQQLDEAIASSNDEIFVVDLRDVRFIDSTAISTLARAEKQLRMRGRQLKIVVGENKNVERLLAITGLQRYFYTQDDTTANRPVTDSR